MLIINLMQIQKFVGVIQTSQDALETSTDGYKWKLKRNKDAVLI